MSTYKAALSRATMLAAGLTVLGFLGFAAFSTAGGTFNWGIFITGFLFFVSATQGAFAMVVAIRMGSAKWSAPFYRLASLVAVSFFPVMLGMLLIMLAFKGNIFIWVENQHPWFSNNLILARNLFFVSAFYVLAYRLFKMAIGSKKAAHADGGNNLNHRLMMGGFWLLIVFALELIVISWDYGMSLNHHWADTIYSIYFTVGALQAGTAFLILLMVALKRFFHVEIFDKTHFYNLGSMLLAFTIMGFYTWWSQFFPTWYANIPARTEPLYLRIFEGYGGLYAVMMITVAIVPFLALIFGKVRGSTLGLAVVSCIVLLGSYINRYLIAIPSLVKEHKMEKLPFLYVSNIAFMVGMLGLVLLGIFILLKRHYPDVLPSSEEVAADPITYVKGW